MLHDVKEETLEPLFQSLEMEEEVLLKRKISQNRRKARLDIVREYTGAGLVETHFEN